MKKFIFVLLLCIFSVPVFAVNGGVQASSITVDCKNANKKADVFDHGSQARLWISVPSGDQSDDLTFSITDQEKVLVNPTNLKTTSCGDGYSFSDITLPDRKGAVTIVVEHADGTKVGSDTLQLR
jgi:hypothetical protein